MKKYARITFETPNGNRVDIVDSVAEVVSSCYIFYNDLEKFLKRVRDFGQKKIDQRMLKVLVSENLFHFRTDL
jgi:hypothetical protein